MNDFGRTSLNVVDAGNGLEKRPAPPLAPTPVMLTFWAMAAPLFVASQTTFTGWPTTTVVAPMLWKPNDRLTALVTVTAGAVVEALTMFWQLMPTPWAWTGAANVIVPLDPALAEGEKVQVKVAVPPPPGTPDAEAGRGPELHSKPAPGLKASLRVPGLMKLAVAVPLLVTVITTVPSCPEEKVPVPSTPRLAASWTEPLKLYGVPAVMVAFATTAEELASTAKTLLLKLKMEPAPPAAVAV